MWAHQAQRVEEGQLETHQGKGTADGRSFYIRPPLSPTFLLLIVEGAYKSLGICENAYSYSDSIGVGRGWTVSISNQLPGRLVL